MGFVPGFYQAPGLTLVLTLVLVIVNANLMVAALVGAFAKLLSLLVMPASFAMGRFLLDGPAQGFFRSMINAPVLAWFGFEYYVVTGGLVLGCLVGCTIGLLVVRSVTAFRRKMAHLDENSETFKRYTQKRWVKIVVWVLFGGGPGKKSYQEKLTGRMGNPIRPLGAAFAALVIVLLVLVQMFAAGPIVTMALQNGLEKANGATVDVGNADLDLKNNHLTITRLAMADPNNLQTDLLRAGKVEADVSGVNLLRKRLQLDRVVLSDASHGLRRDTPGRIVGKPAVTEPPADGDKKSADTKTLDDYLKDARKWKERLAQVKRWLGKMSGPGKAQGPAKQETLQERLEREIREKGYARVAASHLIAGQPTLTIEELAAEKVRLEELPDETITVTARHLSTQPWLLRESPEVTVESSSDRFKFHALADELSSSNAFNLIQFHYNGVPAETVSKALIGGERQVLEGGTLDLAGQGQWRQQNGTIIDLPLQAVLRQATVRVSNLKPTKVDELLVPISVQGDLANPKIRFDRSKLTEGLVKAGASEAGNLLKERAEQEISKKIGKQVELPGKNLLNGLLGGPRKESKE